MRPSENLKRDRYNINVSHTENIHTPPKTNAWNPKIGGLLVDVSPFPFGCIFRFQPLVFRGTSPPCFFPMCSCHLLFRISICGDANRSWSPGCLALEGNFSYTNWWLNHPCLKSARQIGSKTGKKTRQNCSVPGTKGFNF